MAEVHPENDTRETNGRTSGGGSMGGRRGILSSGVQENKKLRGVQEAAGIWGRMPTERGHPVDQTKGLRSSVGVRGPRNDADEVAAAVQRVLAVCKKGKDGLIKLLYSAQQGVIPGDSKGLY